jgi:hypothetical protein
MVHVFIVPIEEDLQHEVELGQGGVTADQDVTPDERPDVAQDDAQLIDVWMGLLLLHAQSGRRHALGFKGAPRSFAVSLYIFTAFCVDDFILRYHLRAMDLNLVERWLR